MIPRLRSSKSHSLSLLVVPILALSSHPLAAQRPAPTQRGGAPGPDTPQLVVSVLASSDPSIGLAARDAIRKRIQSEHTATDIYVTPAATIKAVLEAAGFNPDSVLGTTDLIALATQVRGDYALDGTVERTPNGVTTSVRLVSKRGPQIVAEPLVAIVGSDIGDVAKKVDRAVAEALRALAFNNDCRRAVLVGDYRQAMAAAQQGLRIRPTSEALNLCALSALSATQVSPDSIITVASVVISVDSSSSAAWAYLADAYAAKSDTARELVATRMLHRVDSTNVPVILNLVDRLVGIGQPDPALATLDTALIDSPANADLLKKKWLLELHLGRFAEALKTGPVLIAADSIAATVNFYQRQLGAAANAHDTLASRRIALEASSRFPKTVDFLLFLARDAVDGGSPRDALAFVDRVLAIEPANQAAWQLAIAAHAKAFGLDSTIAVARRAQAAGVSKDAVSGPLVAVVAPVLDAAQSTQSRAAWEKVLRYALAVDSVASSPRSQFYIGVAAYQVATNEAQSLAERTKAKSPSRAERLLMCESSTRLVDFVEIVMIAMPKGGSVDPAIAAQILGALPGVSDYASSVKHAACAKE
jgi:tetratricopeptide (TPR) repeat protein